MRFSGLGFLVASLLFATACKRSVEDESKAYESAVKEAKGLIGAYPGFKKAIEEKLAMGKSLADSAKDMSDKEAAAKKMGDAHRTVSSGLVTELGEVDKLMKLIKSRSVEAAASATSDSEKAAFKMAADNAKSALDKADKSLETGAPDAAGAEGLIKRVKSDLEVAKKGLDTVVSAAAQRTAKSNDDKKKVEATEKKADEKVADWKCPYCSATNKHTHAKCQSCGAARAAKKDDAKK